jgi:hypothetical protein
MIKGSLQVAATTHLIALNTKLAVKSVLKPERRWISSQGKRFQKISNFFRKLKILHLSAHPYG